MSNWADELSESELARLREYKHGTGEFTRPYDDMDTLLADFALMYGWDAVRDFMSNRMSSDFFLRMYKAGKHLQKQREAQLLADMRLACNAAIIGKKANSMFSKELKERQKE